MGYGRGVRMCLIAMKGSFIPRTPPWHPFRHISWKIRVSMYARHELEFR